MEDCCDPAHLFAMTKMNSPMGTSMWYDGEFLYSFTIDNSTYSLFPQVSIEFVASQYSLDFIGKVKLKMPNQVYFSSSFLNFKCFSYSCYFCVWEGIT